MAAATMPDWERLARATVHPTQLAILIEMQDGDRHSPSELAQRLDDKIGNVSYHVRALVDRGLLKAAGTKPRRGAVEHYYRAA